VPNIPTKIEKEAVQIMPGAVNMEKVTRMACNGEVYYSVDYGKLKTCGYCIEYSRKDLFGEVIYFLYSAAVGNAVAVIKPINLHFPSFWEVGSRYTKMPLFQRTYLLQSMQTANS